MKKIVLVSTIIIFLGLLVVSYIDYITFKTRRDLYSDSARISERIAKYNKLLNKIDKIRAKVEVLKRKRIDDNEFIEMIKKCERFLAETEDVRTKKLKLIDEYNNISKQYNRLPSQKFIFRKSLPEILDDKT